MYRTAFLVFIYSVSSRSTDSVSTFSITITALSATTFLTYIPEIPSSNLFRDTDFPMKVFRGFSQSNFKDSQITPLIRPRRLPYPFHFV
jgi:hypothetical protein